MNPIMTRSICTLFAVFTLLLGLGCSAAVPTHYYLLEVPQSEMSAAKAPAAEGLAIDVKTFQVDAPYDDDRIVYRVGDSPETGFYHYHRWAAPLSRMLPRVIASALSGTDGIRRIETGIPGTLYDLALNGRVVRIEEIDTPGKQRVVVQVELRLTDTRGEEVWSGTVRAEEDTQTEEVSTIIETMSAALTRALEPVRAELSRLAPGL